MIFVRKNLGEQLLLCIKASSVYGDGSLYVTSMAVAYEVDGKGLYLNFVPLSSISKIESLGGIMGARCRLYWKEGKEGHVFEFRTKHYKKLYDTINKASLSWTDSANS